MNMNRSRTPPDNAKILPDVYNVLDAHALKKASNMNGMLTCQLTMQQNVISRHRYLAERVHKEEKARVTNALNQINHKLPAVERIRDFNLKFFNNKSLGNQYNNGRSKSYEYNKNDDPVCRRCYNHHFHLKKNKFTNTSSSLPSLPKNRPLPPLSIVDHTKSKEQQDDKNESQEDEVDQTSDDVNFFLSEQETEGTSHGLNLLPDKVNPEQEHAGNRATDSTIKQAFGWWMPVSKTFQFLKKDESGREIDINKHYTPRLMPYEDWKNVVKDVCSHR